MGATTQPAPVSRTVFWIGWVITAVPVLMLLTSGVFKLLAPPAMAGQFVEQFGYPESTLSGIGIVELACVVVYVIPQTAVLGAILLTGYLGGAVATHVRVNDLFIGPVVFGVLVWLGLLLRERRLWPLLPLRRSDG
jgi:hypothetical protein